MIIFQCDICKSKTDKLDTLVLYKKSIDYCKDCKKTVDEIREKFEREVKYENVVFDSWLRTKEGKIINEIKAKNYKGIVIKD